MRMPEDVFVYFANIRACVDKAEDAVRKDLQLAESARLRNSELKDELEDKTEEVRRLDDTNKHLNAALGRTEARIDKARQDARSLEEKVEGLEAELKRQRRINSSEAAEQRSRSPGDGHRAAAAAATREAVDAIPLRGNENDEPRDASQSPAVDQEADHDGDEDRDGDHSDSRDQSQSPVRTSRDRSRSAGANSQASGDADRTAERSRSRGASSRRWRGGRGGGDDVKSSRVSRSPVRDSSRPSSAGGGPDKRVSPSPTTRGGNAGGGPNTAGGSGGGPGGVGTLCFLYIIGKCSQGDSCVSRHPDKEDCKQILVRMQRTSCRYGADCKRRDCVFRHPEERSRRMVDGPSQ
eukprot:TRINITY_DN57540_c0_g1_i1.p1 TRINITY_DN57540_c0_g1~~TRINITY_DN57540_c0_g1_i1.p1  ORF type:complete len:351 (-),score=56.20 TRINITY_DN57540_c0_g1_i1:131-1183(-)